jgi:NADH dehydrogenase
MVYAKVRVTTLNHAIISIDILEHRNGLGKKAESITASMIAKNSYAVDGVSGATGTAAATKATAVITTLSDAVSSATTPAAATPAISDAVTSATNAAGSAAGATASGHVGTVLFNIDFLGLFRAIFVSGQPLGQSKLSDYAFKLDIPLVNWFINNVVLPHQGLALAMQITIVLAEILVGLSLLGGLFTTPSALVSLVLLLMFTSTTGLYLKDFWMVFAGIAFLWGAGSIFGLDYYTTPLLKGHWRRVGWVRRSYLYHD